MTDQKIIIELVKKTTKQLDFVYKEAKCKTPKKKLPLLVVKG